MGHKLFANENIINATLFRAFNVTRNNIPGSWLFWDRSSSRRNYLQQQYGQNLDSTTEFRYSWVPYDTGTNVGPNVFNWGDGYYKEGGGGYSETLYVLIPDSFTAHSVEEIFQLPDQSFYFKSSGLAAFGIKQEPEQGYILVSYTEAITVNTLPYYPGYKAYRVEYGIRGIRDSAYAFINHSASKSYKFKRGQRLAGRYQWSPGSTQVVYEQWFKTYSNSTVGYILPDTFELVERNAFISNFENLIGTADGGFSI